MANDNRRTQQEFPLTSIQHLTAWVQLGIKPDQLGLVEVQIRQNEAKIPCLGLVLAGTGIQVWDFRQPKQRWQELAGVGLARLQHDHRQASELYSSRQSESARKLMEECQTQYEAAMTHATQVLGITEPVDVEVELFRDHDGHFVLAVNEHRHADCSTLGFGGVEIPMLVPHATVDRIHKEDGRCMWCTLDNRRQIISVVAASGNASGRMQQGVLRIAQRCDDLSQLRWSEVQCTGGSIWLPLDRTFPDGEVIRQPRPQSVIPAKKPKAERPKDDQRLTHNLGAALQAAHVVAEIASPAAAPVPPPQPVAAPEVAQAAPVVPPSPEELDRLAAELNPPRPPKPGKQKGRSGKERPEGQGDGRSVRVERGRKPIKPGQRSREQAARESR